MHAAVYVLGSFYSDYTRSVAMYWRQEVTVVVLQVSYVAYLRLWVKREYDRIGGCHSYRRTCDIDARYTSGEIVPPFERP
jgi:hypothetical protein